ncbi:DNA glycosylase [Macroventuria anomochaeta]|uniref:DNA glycosylase n=1 Tax=Macroventuria anomochaeta TaxID=301207 RepID=A0ACB6S0Q7_9PLEO|nr:DNA glycosylase [Macroventuria anomochaeta]KAF2627618.1 DNA glycosylase [Macroventuria anomochaeta]
MQTKVIVKTMPSSDNELSDPPDILSSPPPASFKGQISKYQYAAGSAKENDTSSSASRRPPVKRPRTTTIVVTKPTPSTTLSSPSPRPPKKQRQSSKYADPSKYAHLSPLVDILEPNLICVFVGTNPGVSTALHGHAYAHPSNHFWKLLHSSGLTDRRLAPSEDRSLSSMYCMGNTNIVSRPSKDAAELSKEEMTEGTRDLERKFALYRPEAVCIVGKGIWEAIWRFKYGRRMRKEEFRYGWQDERHNMGRVDEEPEWEGSRVFVTTSTSGLAANLKPAEKEAIWKPFGDWVQRRREERGFVPTGVKEEGAVDEAVKEGLVEEDVVKGEEAA